MKYKALQAKKLSIGGKAIIDIDRGKKKHQLCVVTPPTSFPQQPPHISLHLRSCPPPTAPAP